MLKTVVQTIQQCNLCRKPTQWKKLRLIPWNKMCSITTKKCLSGSRSSSTTHPCVIDASISCLTTNLQMLTRFALSIAALSHSETAIRQQFLPIPNNLGRWTSAFCHLCQILSKTVDVDSVWVLEYYTARGEKSS